MVSFVETFPSGSNYLKANAAKQRLLSKINFRSELIKISFSFHFWSQSHPIFHAYSILNKKNNKVSLLWGQAGFGVKKLAPDLKLIRYYWPLNIKPNLYPISSRSLILNSSICKTLLGTLVKVFVKQRGELSMSNSPLLFVSPDRRDEKYLYITELNLNLPRLDPDSGNLYKNDRHYSSIYKCNWREYIEFIKSIYKFWIDLVSVRKFNLIILCKILLDYKFYYFFNLYVKKSKLSVLINNFEGSSFSVIANWVAKSSKEVVSLNYSWSHGYFPEHRSALNKYSDIFWRGVHIKNDLF